MVKILLEFLTIFWVFPMQKTAKDTFIFGVIKDVYFSSGSVGCWRKFGEGKYDVRYIPAEGVVLELLSPIIPIPDYPEGGYRASWDSGHVEVFPTPQLKGITRLGIGENGSVVTDTHEVLVARLLDALGWRDAEN